MEFKKIKNDSLSGIKYNTSPDAAEYMAAKLAAIVKRNQELLTAHPLVLPNNLNEVILSGLRTGKSMLTIDNVAVALERTAMLEQNPMIRMIACDDEPAGYTTTWTNGFIPSWVDWNTKTSYVRRQVTLTRKDGTYPATGYFMLGVEPNRNILDAIHALFGMHNGFVSHCSSHALKIGMGRDMSQKFQFVKQRRGFK